MTALELNAELYRAMGEIADDETLLVKVLNFVKGLAPAKKSMDKKHGMDENERLDAALARFHKDWGGDGSAQEIADELRHNVVNNRTIEDW